MGLQALHIIDSFAPEPGTPAVPLCAMIRAMSAFDVECRVMTQHDADEVEGAVRTCDVLHVFGGGFGAAPRAMKAARRRGVPYVLTPYGALTEGRYRRPGVWERLRRALGESSLVRGAGMIAAIHEFEASGLRARGLNKAVEVLPPGVDFEEFTVPADRGTKSAMPDDRRVLLVLDPIEPVCGGVPLLKAFAECGALADGWHLAFVGGEVGDWRKQMEAAVRRKGGAERVTFARVADLADQHRWLARAEALACVSLHPRCPTSVVQALAAAVPVLATKEVAPDLPEGSMIVCEASREGITGGLRRLLSMTPDERCSMAQGARECAKARLDVRVVASRYALWYERLARGRAAPIEPVCAGVPEQSSFEPSAHHS